MRHRQRRIISHIQLQTPESPRPGFCHHATLGVHLKISEIQNVERFVESVETHIYRTCKRTRQDGVQAPVGRANDWVGVYAFAVATPGCPERPYFQPCNSPTARISRLLPVETDTAYLSTFRAFVEPRLSLV